ncbi:MAG: MBL fold metallo-hydrolase [Candidatus Heimdallarchaeota archaeon]|nr:MBL fold metallo-hydrolase [Candidatus Heimdallarchaeota archaeon]
MFITPVTMIKMGGSLITYKNDEQRIQKYLKEIDQFLSGKGSIDNLYTTICELMNFEVLNKIFEILKRYITANPDRKIILIHGAGSIGHSLVFYLTKEKKNLECTFPIIKLAVAIQNQIIISSAIKMGLNTISMPSHNVMIGGFSSSISSTYVNSPDLSVLEEILCNSNAIPVFYGDVGFSKRGWKVLSGDIYSSLLIRRFKGLRITKAIFLTRVEEKTTGIYTEDPVNNTAEFISRIEVEQTSVKCYNEHNRLVQFKNYEKKDGKFDVTGAMQGKLENLIDLANNFTKSWVIGIDEFYEALEGKSVGTRIYKTIKENILIKFLGTGDAFNSEGFKSASTLIETEGRYILLDCGPHTLSAMKKAFLPTNNIDLILITHFHGDHTAGVPFILLESMILSKRNHPLTICGPPGVQNVIKALYEALYSELSTKPHSFDIIFLEITPGKPVFFPNLKIQAIKMLHTPEALGYILEGKNMKLAYSGDTGWTESLLELVEGTDLAIIECNFIDQEHEYHLNFHQVKKLAKLTKRLFLTHMGEGVRDDLEEYLVNTNIFIAHEGNIERF